MEAGLRSGNALSPFPEEMNRRIITQLSRLHFAATAHNVANLHRERVAEAQIVLTGNPVVDALHWVLDRGQVSVEVKDLMEELKGTKLIALTIHRRESFGSVMSGNLEVLGAFAERHPDISLVFPVHPNPSVRTPAERVLKYRPRVHLLEPLGYADFVHVLSRAWLAVSDSGGVQEESASLGVPLLLIRENTERPEVLETGIAQLVGGSPTRLAEMLEKVYRDDTWLRQVRKTGSPFGRGDSSRRIVDAIEAHFAAERPQVPSGEVG